jgi:uncharacterized protein YhfF
VFEYENEPVPKAGDTCIITDFFGEPKCVVKTTRVDIVPFGKVTAEFAATEGEGKNDNTQWQYSYFLDEFHWYT